MTRQKRGFLTFIFSLLPGAGEMYMGFFRQGASIMLTFFGIFALASIISISPLIILMPVIWFYSFFHVHNLTSMPPEIFCTVEDCIPFIDDSDHLHTLAKSAKARRIFAVALIIIGASALWKVLLALLYTALPESASAFVNFLSYNVPQALIALLIIYLGIMLIKGKKQELDAAEAEKEEEN